MNQPDVTVAIPLHRSARWVGCIEGNVRRLAPEARVVVSDATEEDDALSTLRGRLADMPDVVWLGKRSIGPGYVPHYNDLLARATTPYFMWLPADDEIDADYVRRCTAVLRRDTGVIMCVGHLAAIAGPDLCTPEFALMPSTGGDVSPLVRVRELFLDWEPFILFRSVFRAAMAPPLRDVGEDVGADGMWVFGVLGRGRVRQIPEVVYRKRFYGGSTHVRMRSLTSRERAMWAFRELHSAIGAPRALAVVTDVSVRRLLRQVTGRGYVPHRRRAACGHTYCLAAGKPHNSSTDDASG